MLGEGGGHKGRHSDRGMGLTRRGERGIPRRSPSWAVVKEPAAGQRRGRREGGVEMGRDSGGAMRGDACGGGSHARPPAHGTTHGPVRRAPPLTGGTSATAAAPPIPRRSPKGRWCRMNCRYQSACRPFPPPPHSATTADSRRRRGGGGGSSEPEAAPRRRPQRRLGRRLEEVAKAVGGGYCRLRMPLMLALGVRGTVAGHRLGALEGGGG